MGAKSHRSCAETEVEGKRPAGAHGQLREVVSVPGGIDTRQSGLHMGSRRESRPRYRLRTGRRWPFGARWPCLDIVGACGWAARSRGCGSTSRRMMTRPEARLAPTRTLWPERAQVRTPMSAHAGVIGDHGRFIVEVGRFPPSRITPVASSTMADVSLAVLSRTASASAVSSQRRLATLRPGRPAGKGRRPTPRRGRRRLARRSRR